MTSPRTNACATTRCHVVTLSLRHWQERHLENTHRSQPDWPASSISSSQKTSWLSCLQIDKQGGGVDVRKHNVNYIAATSLGLFIGLISSWFTLLLHAERTFPSRVLTNIGAILFATSARVVWHHGNFQQYHIHRNHYPRSNLQHQPSKERMNWRIRCSF